MRRRWHFHTLNFRTPALLHSHSTISDGTTPLHGTPAHFSTPHQHQTSPHRTTPHHTAPHRTAPLHTAPLHRGAQRSSLHHLADVADVAYGGRGLLDHNNSDVAV
jgi:hypothetical protein